MGTPGNFSLRLNRSGLTCILSLVSTVLLATPAAPQETGSSSQARPVSSSVVAEQYAKLPLIFEPNVGQTDASVRFFTRTDRYSLFLTSQESVFVLRSGSGSASPRTSVVRMHLFGASQNSEFVGLVPLPGKTNYLIGNHPEAWHTNVPQYAKVIERDIYHGVDLSYYGNQRCMESDFIVSPRANAQAIAMSFQGAKKLRVDSQGNLVVATDAGELVLRKPVAYQQLASGRELIAASYTVQGNRVVRFSLGKYDRSRPLIIDPILEYSTYLGGSNVDVVNAIAVAPDNTAFVAGGTYSTDFPTVHPLQPNHGGSDDIYKDAFVSKLSADGSTLLYSTYIGGKNDDIANGIAVDSYGDAYVVGTTESPDFPVPSTLPTFNPLCGGDGECGASWNPNHLIVPNGFVIKLNPEGSAPLYSGFVGYYEYVFGQAIAVDANQLAYIVGRVGPNITPTVTITPPQVPPPPFPISADAAQGTFGGGDYDAFVAVISSTGNSILYSTYLGGTNEDDGYGIAADNNQNAYVTGLTYSPDFPVTGSAYQSAAGGNGDAFFAKINTHAGGAPAYSTYLGGPNLDQGNAIALDSSDNAYITGATSSAGLSSSSSYKGQGDAFVAKFNPGASGSSSLVYFTYLGGSFADSGNGIGLDSAGNVYVTGSTVSTDFPIAGAVFQTQYAGGNSDGFVSKLDPTGSTLLYSTYLGGSNTDAGYGIAVDTSGSAYVAGQTCSQDFPLSNPEQPTYGGNCDAFVSKISILDGIILTPTGLAFPSLNIGATSLPQTVNLVNGDNSVSISSISLMGANPSDFAFRTTCPNPGTLSPGAQCSFSLTFSPQAAGVRKAYVSITYTVNGTILNPVLSLTGSTSTVQLSASTLNFGNQSIAATSSPQPVLVTNIGSAPLTISSITASGDYAETDTCTKAPLQPNTNCAINVTFAPSVAGTSTGALTINDNVAGSPQVVLLNGTGLQPDFAITSTPSSATVVAGNSATVTLSIASISGYSQQIGLACSGLPANATCSVSPATVTPTANQSTTATVTFTTGVRTVIPPAPFVPSWPAPIFTISMLSLLLLVAAVVTLIQRPRATVVAAFTALLFAVMLIGACNGGTAASGAPGTPAGTYKIVITGTSGTLSHSTTVSLQVK